MFIRRPKDDRLKWGVALDEKIPPAPNPVFYIATTGKQVGGITPAQLRASASLAAQREIPYKDRGDFMTMNEIEMYIPVIDGGLLLQPRSGKERTVNHMLLLLSSRRWVCDLLRTHYDSPDGKRKIPKENYRLGMLHMKRAWMHSFVLFHIFFNTQGAGTLWVYKLLNDTVIMTERAIAYGWPILEPEDANNDELVRQAGLELA
jgi:hypothetical protein